MYCSYTANSTWTMAQVMDDFRLLLTGTTDVNSLSASCNKVSTTITSTIAAGWNTHDSADGSANGGFVVSRLDAGNSVTKYVRVYSSTATQWGLATMDGWNAGTNAATNATAWSSATAFTAGTAFTINVFATPDYIGFLSPAFGSTSIWALEFGRDTPQHLSSSGVNCNFQIYANSTGYIPSIHDPIGTTTLTNQPLQLMTVMPLYGQTASAYSGFLSGAANLLKRASDNNEYVHVQPFYAGWAAPANAVRSLPFGKVRGGLYVGSQADTAGTHGNTITIGADTYYIARIYFSGGTAAQFLYIPVK